MTKEKAYRMAEKAWQLIEENSKYSFNSSHAYSVALDGLYGAYLKSNHTYEYYEAILEIYSEKKDSDRVSAIIHEMDVAFDIQLGKYSFGLDNRTYTSNKELKTIYPSLSGVKYVNEAIADILYEEGKKKHKDFYDVYAAIKSYREINKRTIDTLVKIGYFEKFGSRKMLSEWIDLINGSYKKKSYNKEKTDPYTLSIIKDFAIKETAKMITVDPEQVQRGLFNTIEKDEYSMEEMITHEISLTGKYTTEVPNDLSVGEIAARSWKKPVFLFKSWINNADVWINAVDKEEMPNRGDIVILKGIYSATKTVYNKKRMEHYANVIVVKKAKK